MSSQVKRIDIKEFRRLGFLQEVNRQFFHPLGLALEVIVNYETGEETIGGVWDYRDDPEGVLFADGELDAEKAANVDRELESHYRARVKLLGSIIQSVG